MSFLIGIFGLKLDTTLDVIQIFYGNLCDAVIRFVRELP